ncbi:MAG: sel1 repeat family protein [Candidatus Adiutrix sp.]|jgi:hypothetical protein|nr:sel1 repeat family protein [Candidatus Adiutrix sp.]
MLRLPLKLIAFVFCFLFVVPPQMHACRGGHLEYTLFLERLGQKPSDAERLVELPPDVDVIAEVILTGANSTRFGRTTAAKIVRVIKTSDARVRQGEEIPIKFLFTTCAPNYRSGNKGTIAAKIGTDIEDRFVLCPYSRMVTNGHIKPPIVSECDPSEIEAARQIKLAAENGDVKAQIALGSMYKEGKNVRHDNAEAMKWFRLAAESGDAEAQYNFGRKNYRNAIEALKWFELAAAQGHTEAMYSIGWMYEYGKFGIKQSEAEAEKWYRLAAEKGNWSAKSALKRQKEKRERNINLGICILAGVVLTAMVLRRLSRSKSRRPRDVPKQ